MTPTLARHMGLFALIVYGVGDMVGSGIYGTIGKAAGQMGNAVWLAFVVAMVAAMLTGLSYACIASRYPRAAGAAYVTHRAFRLSFLSYVLGLTITASGLTSMATSTRVFAATGADLFGFAKSLDVLRLSIGGVALVDTPWAVVLVILGFLLFMTFVNFWGIRESMWTNMLCTAVEVGGLLFVIAVGMRYWGSVSYLDAATLDVKTGEVMRTGLSTTMLFSGAVLTFFAFVGFEDMLNMGEEVKAPQRAMPFGIVIALAVVALLYVAVSITAVSVVDYPTLARAAAPLEAITNVAAAWLPRWVFKAITMFAVANTVLINYIMGSRLLYGMARQGMLPTALGRVHAKRRTPHVAILTLLAVVIMLALSGQVQDLGSATGLLLLCCFMVVNAALIVLKLRKTEPRGKFEVPVIVPALGIVVNIALVAARVTDANVGRRPVVIAAVIVAVIALLYFVMRPKAITEETLAEAKENAESAN